jgi:hypothetical protein
MDSGCIALNISVFDDHETSRAQKRCGSVLNIANNIQPILAAEESDPRFVVTHLGFAGRSRLRDVGRVRNNDSNVSAPRVQFPTVIGNTARVGRHHRHRASPIRNRRRMNVYIATRPGKRSFIYLDGCNLNTLHFRRKCEGKSCGTRAQINCSPLTFCCLHESSNRSLCNKFSLWSRHENTRTDSQIKVSKGSGTDKMLQRYASHSTRQQHLKLRALLRCNCFLEQHSGSRHSRHMTGQDSRICTRAGHTR